MRGTIRNLGRKAVLGWRYLDSAVRAPVLHGDFAGIRAVCLFIGYPRSGHSLVGSLLDAHPDVILAHEANALKLLRYGFSRDQIFFYLLRNSRLFTEQGRRYTGYTYHVPGQWQGRYRHLRVIGDKHGNFAVEALRRRPALLARARTCFGAPLRFVHVVRNPFDNIATIHRREKHDLPGAADYYFSLADDALAVAAQLPPADLLTLYHEDLVSDPAATIRRWCAFFELEPFPDYIDACAAIVFPSPHQSRREVAWPAALVEDIRARLARYPFLAERYAAASEGPPPAVA